MSCSIAKLIGIEIELGNHLCCQSSQQCPHNDSFATTEMLCVAHKKLFGIVPKVDNGCKRGLDEFGIHQFRFYPDHGHAEIASPLTKDAKDLVLWQRRAKQLAKCCQKEAAKKSGQILLHCANTNRSGSAWGFHLNVLVSRRAFNKWRDSRWHLLFSQWIPFLVSSPILFGTGKVGSENGRSPASYQLSQRADFIDKLVGSETVCSKSLIHDRDEPLADPTRYARFHISAAFDFNCCEFASWLKFGIVQIMLALIETGTTLPMLALKDPLAALARVSRDVEMSGQLELMDESNCTAIDIQEQLAFSANRALEKGVIDDKTVPLAKNIVNAWIITLVQLRKNDHKLRRRLDWITKKHALDQMRSRLMISWQDSRLLTLDLKYAEIDGGWFEMLERHHFVDRLEDFLPNNAVRTEPNSSDRDVSRARILNKFRQNVVALDWHHICLNVTQNGSPKIYKINLENPLDASEIKKAIDAAHTASEFIDCLPKYCYQYIKCNALNNSLSYEPPFMED